MSFLLLGILALIALLVLAGLAIVAIQLSRAEAEIGRLRDQSLPRMVKLSQLSQESSASIAIAPALSTNPSRFEFETLLSRMKDKRHSQADLLSQLSALIEDDQALTSLNRNSALLTENQTALTTTVRQQINIGKRLEKHYATLRSFSRAIEAQPTPKFPKIESGQILAVIAGLQGVLLDPIRARFSRNRREILASIDALESGGNETGEVNGPLNEFLVYWTNQGNRMLEDKNQSLANAFKIKALVEENSLIANRLLNTTSSEFARSSEILTDQIRQIASATRYNLLIMLLLVVSFLAGSLGLWFTMQRRIFRRLGKMREALRLFAEDRANVLGDEAPDEIGEIARALSAYMDKIDRQEFELESKAKDLEDLSTRLAKYLSPQVYESIFSGKQQVAVQSTRKKLTVFFSDIVEFTQLADQQESEELTQLLNTYLTEMSRIALDHGATIDKYVGDAMMVFFGDPETHGVQEDALQCVKMAIAMRERLAKLSEEWQKRGISRPVDCRMGMHTGYCTVGNFGSEERMDYTIIGGTVNTASRLEAAAKPGQILISYETHALVSNDVECSEEGQISVKGIAYPVSTFSVVGPRYLTGKTAGKMHEVQIGMNLEIDCGAMNASDREKAIKTLKHAIRQIDQ